MVHIRTMYWEMDIEREDAHNLHPLFSKQVVVPDNITKEQWLALNKKWWSEMDEKYGQQG